MDQTTLVLAVDSSAISSASVALQKMAAEGSKAETVTAKLASTAAQQGKALNAGIVKNAQAAADSIKGLAGATTSLAGAQDFSKTTSSLADAAAQAKSATAEVRALGSAVASIGPIAAQQPATAGLGAIATATAQQTTNPSASAALSSFAAKQKNQASAFPPVSAETSSSIDKYIKQLQLEQVTFGMTRREAEKYKLALQGASDAQLKEADHSLQRIAALERGAAIAGKLKIGLLAVAAAGAAAGVGLFQSVKGAIDAADHLNDLSKQTGIAVDTLGGLGFAASQSGGDLETIASAAGKLNKSIAQAGRGNKEYGAVFSAMGINIRDASGELKKADVVLAEMADKFSTYADGPNKAALSNKALGASSAALIGLLNDGGKALRDNIEYYKKYGGVTQEVADKADQFNDTMGKVSLLSSAAGRQIAADLLPALTQISEQWLKAKENGTGLISVIHAATGEINKLVAELVVGTKEAGSFWSAVSLVATRNPFRSLQDNIKSYRDDLKAAEADLDRFRKAGKDTGPVEASIQRTKARIAIAQVAADQEAMQNNGPGRADPRKFDSRIPKPKEKPDAPAIPKTGGAGRGNNEASQVLREQLGEDISAIKAALDAETATLAFHQREMQGIYQAGGISLKDYYNDQRESIAAGVQAKLRELDKEIARLEQYKNKISDPSEKVKTQKQIDQTKNEKEKVSTAGGREAVIANQAETASFLALKNQVAEYNATLLQMQGDELGAARIRAQIAVQSASLLSRQGAKDEQGNAVQFDIEGYKRKLEITNLFADAQRKAGDLAQNTARAEEAANLASETGGKSLLETENAVYAVRSRAVDQLGTLAAKAAELAKVSTDPKIKQFAADLALAYAKAADAIDPALQRLRDAQKELAAGVTSSINSGIAGFGKAYADVRKAANDEVKTEKDKLDRKIELQEGYLATTRDKAERERIKQKIKDLEAQKAGVKPESKGSSLLKTANTSILQPLAGQAFATVNKLLVTDPLQKYLEGQFKSLTEGDGLFAGVLKSGMGIKDTKAGLDPKALADQAAATANSTLASSITTQTTAVQAATTATEQSTGTVKEATDKQREQATALGDVKTALEQNRTALDDQRTALEAATKAANDFATAAGKAGQGAGGSSGSSSGGSSGSGLFGGGSSGGSGSGSSSLGSLGGGSSLPDVPLGAGGGDVTLFSSGTKFVLEDGTTNAGKSTTLATSTAVPATGATAVSAASALFPVAAATVASVAATQKSNTATTAATKATVANTNGLTDEEKKSNQVTGILAGLLTTGGLLSAFTESKSPNGAFSSGMLSSSEGSALQRIASASGGDPSGNNPYQGQIAAFDGTLPDGTVNYNIAGMAAIQQAKSAVDYGGIAASNANSTIAGQLSGLFGDKSGNMGSGILSTVGGLLGTATGIPGGGIIGGMLAKKLGSIKIDTKPFTDNVEDKTKEGFTELGTQASTGNMGISDFFGSMEKSLSNGFGDVSSLLSGSGAGASSGGSGGLGGIFGSLFGGGGSTSGMATNSAGMASGQGVSAEAIANLMEYGLADGGLVKGPGSGQSDSIPAKLSNGEFVMPAAETAKHLQLLEALRGGETVSSLLQHGHHAGGNGRDGGQSSATVLQGLLTRMGVKNDEPALASALRIHGARELGGPVSAGKLYRVNEKRPELLNVSGKQYLMMGSQGGKVDPNPQMGGGGRPIAVTNNFHLGAPTNHSTQRQMALAASRSISDAARRNG